MARITEILAEREKEVRPFIEKYADLFDLDPDLIRGLITQECLFVGEAVSPTGAFGYGQFTGIGARQVQNISRMTDKAADLSNFTKSEADDPDRGIKAICATLWWLFNRKYHRVRDKKVQLEAVLTFYNSGGRPAALVIKHGGHAQAVPFIKKLPRNFQSQSVKYAPQLAAWFVTWHEYMIEEKKKEAVQPAVPGLGSSNPFDDVDIQLSPGHKALLKVLVLFAREDESVDILFNSRDGLTELTLIFPGEVN